jgi:hypothetical protein
MLTCESFPTESFQANATLLQFQTFLYVTTDSDLQANQVLARARFALFNR